MKLIPKTNKPPKKVLLVILDGVGIGINKPEEGNAVRGAKLPFLETIWELRPTLKLQAHGKAVGMPSNDDMGNSEVGHNVLGAGRIFDQGAKLVSQSIERGEIFHGEVWKKLIQNVKSNQTTLHLIGLLSDGNVHSHIDHLKALIKKAKDDGVSKLRIHCLLDGRDVAETSALSYTEDLEKYLTELNQNGFDSRIASGGGRMEITMDRYEADWSMIEKGWKIHVEGEGRGFSSIKDAIETYRKENPSLIDQYIPGFVIHENGKPCGTIENNDSVIFYNFRGDRAIEISRAFSELNLDKIKRNKFPKVEYAGMMQYDGDLKIPTQYLVPPPAIDRTMGEYLAKEKIPQYAMSETQKFGHVTFFWNGNRSGYFDSSTELYEEIKSDVIPFDQKPEMKAPEITDQLIKRLREGKHQFYRVNFANGDMVGHTGNYKATIKAMECLDHCIDRIIMECLDLGIVLLITADHGNADEMFQLDKKGKPVLDSNGKPSAKTSHTLNPVPFSLIDPEVKIKLKPQDPNFGLANVAATVLDLLGYEAPEGYHPSLIA
jgi:2,3-bisphosphoglycerate-independent phosphoglycerate mutase